MPLHYVMLFPADDYDWHWGLRLEKRNDEVKRLTQRSFYRHRLHFRKSEFLIIFLSERLFQQYLVDAWAICEQTKLDWIKSNQDSLRADVYKGLADATFDNDTDLNQIDQKFILPSSFTSGPRFMAKLYQDAMAISRFYGKPSGYCCKSV